MMSSVPSSLFWFACGAFCASALLHLNLRRLRARRRPAPRGRRAWLERDAMRLPDPDLAARIARIEAEVIEEHLAWLAGSLAGQTREALALARRDLRPAIQLRMKQ